MKNPDDTKVNLKDVLFQGGALPMDAILYGFTVPETGAAANRRIMSRLQFAANANNPDAIVMDGRWTGKPPPRIVRGEELQETPFAPFASNFEMVVNRLVLRYQRLKELVKNDTSPMNVDLFTYQDVVLTSIAAICVESESLENYTVKVYLRRQKHPELFDPIRKVLERVICVDCDRKPITVAHGVKVLRDKFLCHLDNFEDYDMQGKEGLSKGKWTPGDRIVLGHLLLPLVTDGPVDELVHLIVRAVNASTEIGTQELLRTAFDKALEIAQGRDSK